MEVPIGFTYFFLKIRFIENVLKYCILVEIIISFDSVPTHKLNTLKIKLKVNTMKLYH